MNIPAFSLTEQFAEIAPEIMAAVERVLRSGHYILGPEVEAFEHEMAQYIGVKHAIGVANGSDALLLALMAIGIAPGDEVIVPAFTFFATAGSVARLGAKPVFSDIDASTYNLAASNLERLINEHTKAIIPVHLFGQMAEMNAIEQIAQKHGLALIEDAAQAIGAKYDGRGSCTVGDIGCLSFYPTKNLGACGDAGMLLTNDDALAAKLKILRVHGALRKYYHSDLGFNSRLDEIQAAILRVKLAHLPEWIRKRQELARRYDEGLADLAGEGKLRIPFRQVKAEHVYHQYAIRTSERDGLREFMQVRGIGTAVYYPRALHLQEVFACYGGQPGALPESEDAARTVLSLPMFPELRPDAQDRVIETIKQYYRQWEGSQRNEPCRQ